jgi:hypothetical protein
MLKYVSLLEINRAIADECPTGNYPVTTKSRRDVSLDLKNRKQEMAREIVRQRKREDPSKKRFPPEAVPKRGGCSLRKEKRGERRDFIGAAGLA